LKNSAGYFTSLINPGGNISNIILWWLIPVLPGKML